MLTEQDLQGLIGYRSTHPVLSVYLDVDPSTDSADAHKLRLRQLLKALGPEAAADAEAVERFVEHEYGWTARSLAIFSCQPERFFRSYSLMVPLRSRARRMERPYVKPLADLLESYGDYGVALVDRQGARLFHFHLGELREQEGTLGEEVRRVKRGGGSQATGQRGVTNGKARSAESAAERNLRQAAQFATRFFQDKHVRRVLIAGTEENAARFTSLLPKAYQSLVLGTFPMEMTASHVQVLEKAMALARRSETEKTARLVAAIITAAAKGREGVVGLQDTLAAVHAGRVQTLAFRDGLRAPGYRCTGCGYVSATHPAACPFCGKPFETIEDAVELAVRRVLGDGEEVAVVPESHALDAVGGIGALLRY